MKVVFHLSELKEDIEDGAGRLFEAQGGTLGDNGLTLTSMNKDTQELLFTIAVEADGKSFDLSPTVSDEGYSDGADPDLDGVNPDD